MVNEPRLVLVALGGNALLRRGEPMTADAQRANVRVAADDHVRLRESVHPRPGPYGTAYQDFLALRETGSRSWPLLAEMRSRT